MIIIPAIDLRSGRCVRLLEGKAGTETIYADDPLEQARVFLRDGAVRIHVVDLDGAFDGESKNREVIEQLARIAPIEVGGGLRERTSVARVLELGARYAMIGTLAAEQPALFRELCAEFPAQIIAAIDAKNGKVAVRGWVETTALDAAELAKRCEADGAAAIIYTDIARDGTGRGINVEQTEAIARAVNIPVYASGGVHRLDDLRALKSTKLAGAIVGRAIYEKTLDLAEAIREVA
jgi:phosphoribosylformimino-5-aminoimidazole carboxamide ribotide isomerase